MLRSRMRRAGCAVGLVSAPVLAAVATENRAWAWGHTGHVEIGAVVADSLPWQIKAMLDWRSADSAIAEWNAELDVSKGAGQTHDFERDPGHYIDIDDAGKVLGGVDFNAMPVSRRDYNTALRAGGQTQYGAGYLYYSMIDGWQQIRMDFA